MTTWIFARSMPREARSSRNDSVTDTIASARRYMESSSLSSMRITGLRSIAPTATIDAGHRSRSSNTHGKRRTPDSAQVPSAQKNCGEVDTTTSGRFSKSPATKPLTMKLM